jgi:hypothetical protein
MEIKIKLSNTEHKDLLSYCNLNDLLISEVAKKSFTTGFNIERYGLLNPGGNQEKEVIKEVVVEKRVEIPVEVIKEIVQVEYVEVPVERVVEKIVEVIKEVPVERVVEKIVEVIKEVPVEKVVVQEVIKEIPVEKIITKTEYVSDDTQINELLSKIQQLEEMPPKVVEVIKEVPVDRVVIQEKTIEVPVEKIVIQEKIVEVIKEVVGEGGDKSKLDALQSTVMKLRQETLEKDKKIREYEQTIQDIQKFQEDRKAVYLSGSNLNKTL